MNNNSKKVSVIGCGVGSVIAYALMMKEFPNENVIIDRERSITHSEMLDIRHGIPYMGMCILNKRATIAFVSSVLDGEYGIKDVSMSFISEGVERTLADYLNDEYKSMRTSYAVPEKVLEGLNCGGLP